MFLRFFKFLMLILNLRLLNMHNHTQTTHIGSIFFVYFPLLLINYLVSKSIRNIEKTHKRMQKCLTENSHRPAASASSHSTIWRRNYKSLGVCKNWDLLSPYKSTTVRRLTVKQEPSLERLVFLLSLDAGQ